MTEEVKIRVVVVDDIAETRENIRKLLQFEGDVEVVGMARTGAEGIDIVKETLPDVVLMDINMPDMDGITATEKIRAIMPATQIVILSVQSDSNYMRRAMLAGARDFLTKPPDVDELTAAIRRAGEMAQQERAKEANTLAAVRATGPGGFAGSVNGKIVTIYSPKGGTGSTTITANLAVALTGEETKVAAVDGRLQYGDLSFFFNEQGRNNILDLASLSGELDPDVVNEVLIQHEATGVDLLAAPPRPEHAESVTGEQFAGVLRYLASIYDYVLVDASSELNEVTLASIDNSDFLIVISTQDIPSIKNVRLFLDLLTALGVQTQQVLMMMNRFDKRRSITSDRVGDITKQPIVAVVPVDERLVIPAMDRGVPFITQAQRTNPVVKGILDLGSALKERVAQAKDFELE